MSRLKFWMLILGREFLEGELLRGLFFLEEKRSEKVTPEFGPRNGRLNIRIPEFNPEFRVTRCKIPSAEILP